MPNWADIATASGILALCGATVDLLLLRAEKTALHGRLVALWTRLDAILIPELPAAVVRGALRTIRFVFGPRLSIRFLARTVFVSFLVTTGCGNAGTYLQGYSQKPHIGLGLYTPEVYVLNFVFDAATLAMSVLLFQRMVVARPAKVVSLGAVNIIGAAALALLCAVATTSYAHLASDAALPTYRAEKAWEIDWAARFVRAHMPASATLSGADIEATPWRPGAGEQARYVIESAGYWLLRRQCCHQIEIVATVVDVAEVYRVAIRGPVPPMRLEGLLYSATTLLPITTVVAVVLLAGVARSVLGLSRAVAVRALRAATQGDPKDDPKDFMPATLLAVLLGTIACGMRAIWALATMALKS